MRNADTAGLARQLSESGPGSFEGKHGLSDQFFSVNGVLLRFTMAGEGEPVLLLHGFLGDIETSWTGGPYGPQPRILPALARKYRTIGMDCRGHGRSDSPRGPRQYGGRMAEDVVRLLDHLGIGRVHLVGYSMGALIAGKVLGSHPNRVLSAVLGGGGVYAQSLFPDGRAPEDEEMAIELEQGKGITTFLMASVPKGQPGPTPQQAQTISDYLLRDRDVPALVDLARGMSGLGVSDAQLVATPVPVLAMIGTQDEGIPRVEHLRSRMPHLEIRLIEGADHASAVAHPTFLAAIEEHLGDGLARDRERRNGREGAGPADGALEMRLVETPEEVFGPQGLVRE